MKFENTEVMNFDGALRGMRNPMNSWDKSDSYWGCSSGSEHLQEYTACDECLYSIECNNVGRIYVIGEKDMKLAQKLIKAGSEHRKFMRQIFVCVDVTAPMYWWKEYDTYKVATVRNSCSTMHKIHVKPFCEGDFAHDCIDKIKEARETFLCVIDTLELLRQKFNETQDKNYWRAIIQLLPDGFEIKATLTFNYENLLGICSKGQRRNHKLNEWSGKDSPDDPNFIAWARKLPYSQELIFVDELDNEGNE